MKKFILSFGVLVLSMNFFGTSQAQQTPATGYVPGGGVTTSAPTTSIRPQARPDDLTTSPSTSTSTASSSSSSSSSTTSSTAPATVGSAGYYQVKLQEPLSGQSAYVSAANGVDLINQYISMIYMWMASIVGIIAVLMIVVSGIQIIFGGASPELVSDAKNRITQSLLSLVLLFATAMILRTVNPNFFGFM